MTEKELINKIKQLKQIKPQKDWVVFCKGQILKKEDKSSIISVFQSLFSAKPLYVVSATAMLLIIVMTGFFVFKDRTVENEALVKPEPAPDQEIVLALENLQIEMDKTIKTLKELKKPQQILEARNVIVPTIEMAREIVTEVEKKEINQDAKVLAVKIDELENTLDKSMAVLTKDLIKFLETRTFTEAQQKILEQAKNDYNQGNYHQALINAMLIQQMIKE
jgi:hypothetical protein